MSFRINCLEIFHKENCNYNIYKGLLNDPDDSSRKIALNRKKTFLYKILNHYRNSFKIEESILKMSYNEIYFDFIDDSEKIHTEPLTKLKQDINDQIEPLIAGIATAKIKQTH